MFTSKQKGKYKSAKHANSRGWGKSYRANPRTNKEKKIRMTIRVRIINDFTVALFVVVMVLGTTWVSITERGKWQNVVNGHMD